MDHDRDRRRCQHAGFAQHWARNIGDEPAEIIWWVPGEMHTDEWKEKIHTGEGKWYEREPVTFDGPRARNEGFPSHIDDLSGWPPAAPTAGALDMQHLPRSTWLHTIQGTDRRRAVPVSFFYCDERIRCAKVHIPHSGETEPKSGDYERLLYVESGTLAVTLVGTGTGLVAEPGDMVFLPPFTEHCLQAIDVGTRLGHLGLGPAGVGGQEWHSGPVRRRCPSSLLWACPWSGSSGSGRERWATAGFRSRSARSRSRAMGSGRSCVVSTHWVSPHRRWTA